MKNKTPLEQEAVQEMQTENKNNSRSDDCKTSLRLSLDSTCGDHSGFFYGGIR